MRSFEEIDKLQMLETLALSAMHETERRKLYELCSKIPGNGLAVEVGCQLGCSSTIISGVGYDLGYNTVHIDPYTQQPGYLNGWTNQMMKLVGDWDHRFCLLCMRTEQALWYLERLFRDGIDFAFIDGDHLAKGVEIDMDVIASKITRGGRMACHDYGHVDFPGVKEEVDRYVMRDGGWHFEGMAHGMSVWYRK